MKKLVSLFVTLIISATCVFAFTGCGQKPVYSESYTINETHHWRNLVSGEGDDFIEYEEHVNEKGRCKCGKYYECPELIYRPDGKGGLICYGATYEFGETTEELLDSNGSYLLSNRWRHIEVPATKEYEGVEYPVTQLASYAFLNEDLLSIKLNEGLLSINTQAFAKVRNLKEVIIPNSVVTVGSSVFFENSSIERVVMGDGMTQVGSYFFYDCTSLKEVVIGRNVRKLLVVSFARCSSLEYLILPASLEVMELHILNHPTIDPTWNYSPFNGVSPNMKFFLEHDQIPEGFGVMADWNTQACDVYLAGQWEYDQNGKPKVK